MIIDKLPESPNEIGSFYKDIFLNHTEEPPFDVDKIINKLNMKKIKPLKKWQFFFNIDALRYAATITSIIITSAVVFGSGVSIVANMYETELPPKLKFIQINPNKKVLKTQVDIPSQKQNLKKSVDKVEVKEINPVVNEDFKPELIENQIETPSVIIEPVIQQNEVLQPEEPVRKQYTKEEIYHNYTDDEDDPFQETKKPR